MFVATEDDRRLLKEVLHNKNCSALFNFELFLSNLNVICKAAVIFPLLLLALEVSHRATSESAPTCQLRSLPKLKVRTYVFVLGANSVPLCESSGHLLLQGTS